MGCVCGRALEIAEKQFNAYAAGVGLRLDLILGGKASIFSRPQNPQKRHRIDFIQGNYYDVNLGSVDVLYAYLEPRSNTKLALNLARELKDGERIVTYEFVMPWNYDKRINVVKLLYTST